MLKLVVGIFLLSLVSCRAENTCSVANNDIFENFPTWIDFRESSSCYNASIEQIKMEMDASYTYLSIGAHFSRDTINRPGFADFFFKAAKEEREHAVKLIEYLSMRGHLNKVSIFNHRPTLRIVSAIVNGADALQKALELEEDVTKSIRKLIAKCEKDDAKYNHYHTADWLTGVYLEEQLHGKRELAGKLSTLKKMAPGELGEFLLDKNM